jgi:hypothetical protein
MGHRSRETRLGNQQAVVGNLLPSVRLSSGASLPMPSNGHAVRAGETPPKMGFRTGQKQPSMDLKQADPQPLLQASDGKLIVD